MDGTVIVPSNDLAAVEAALERYPGEIAGMILEPIMMNAGIIYPDDGYLAALKDLLHAHGALLTFDEVKTGFTVGPGGASGMLGVTSDLVCVAKAMGGGLSTVRDRRRRGDGAGRRAATTSRSARSTATRWRWPPRGPCSPRC